MDDENLTIGGPPTALSDGVSGAAQAHYGPGLVKYRECDLCGWLTWASTATSAPPGIEVTRFAPKLYGEQCPRCPRCQEAHARAPEVFNWMLGVVARLVTKVGDTNKT